MKHSQDHSGYYAGDPDKRTSLSLQIKEPRRAAAKREGEVKVK